MAETSGFFDSQWDATIENPETGEPGYWDRAYLSSQFSKYFSLFIGNGVFGSPTNQLRVIPVEGDMAVMVSEGFAFINGYWYYNDSPKILPVQLNGGTNPRYDSIRVRFSSNTRVIETLYFAGNTSVVRNDVNYDLKLAEITIPVGTATISEANIKDTRPDETVCGFVTSLLEVQTTKDLFAQYQAIFEAWFEDIKGQLSGDLGARLQTEFIQAKRDMDAYYENTSQQVAISQGLISDYVNNDYVIQNVTLQFENLICDYFDSKITEDSLIDVYFTADTIDDAEAAMIIVDSRDGYIRFSAKKEPLGEIKAYIRVRVQ